MWRIAGAAFVLGFAHQEEFEIIGLCAGSEFCLEIMVVYALAVILAIVALTLLMIAGYRRLEGRLEHVARHLPKFSGAILIAMGAGFIAGISVIRGMDRRPHGVHHDRRPTGYIEISAWSGSRPAKPSDQDPV